MAHHSKNPPLRPMAEAPIGRVFMYHRAKSDGTLFDKEPFEAIIDGKGWLLKKQKIWRQFILVSEAKGKWSPVASDNQPDSVPIAEVEAMLRQAALGGQLSYISRANAGDIARVVLDEWRAKQ